MRGISLFSGAGGYDLGFERAGIEIVLQCEIDLAARSVLARHWPDAPRIADVRDVDGSKFPADVVFYGSPCQDLSLAGKRAGFGGERSGLFFEGVRVARECGAAWLVWENVGGALSSLRGLDFLAVLDALADAGAVDIAWRVLDAQWFGCAQRRRRLFVVADFRAERAGEVLALAEGLRGHPQARGAAREDVAGTLGGDAGRRGRPDDTDRATFVAASGDSRAAVTDAAAPLRGGGRAQQAVAHPVTARQGKGPDSSMTSGFCVDVAHTLSAEGADASEDGTSRGTPLIVFRADDDGQGAADALSPTIQAKGVNAIPFAERTRAGGRNLETSEIAYALTNPGSGGQAHSRNILDSMLRVRRLTPRECERLQGWPDDQTRWDARGVELSDSTRYRLIGNGVAAPVAEWIAGRLVAVTEEAGR